MKTEYTTCVQDVYRTESIKIYSETLQTLIIKCLIFIFDNSVSKMTFFSFHILRSTLCTMSLILCSIMRNIVRRNMRLISSVTFFYENII